MAERDGQVVIYKGSLIDAGLLKGLLEDASIPAYLQHEITSALLPGVSLVGVAVSKQDREKAGPIVHQFIEEQSRADASPPNEERTPRSVQESSLLRLGIIILAAGVAGFGLHWATQQAVGKRQASNEVQKLMSEVYTFADEGLYGEATKVVEKAVEIAEKQFGSEHPEFLNALDWLGVLQSNRGNYQEAEALWKRLLAIQERRLGTNNSRLIAPLLSLASLYGIQGRDAEAAPMYQRVIEIRQRIFGEQHVDVEQAYEALADTYYALGEYGQAEIPALRVLAIRESRLGRDHPEVAAAQYRLAYIYEAMGTYDKAEQHYQRALAIREGALGLDHPGVAAILADYANLLRKAGRVPEAEVLEARVKDIRSKHQETESAASH